MRTGPDRVTNERQRPQAGPDAGGRTGSAVEDHRRGPARIALQARCHWFEPGSPTSENTPFPTKETGRRAIGPPEDRSSREPAGQPAGSLAVLGLLLLYWSSFPIRTRWFPQSRP
ncbi:hypothetical protein Pve01_19480 [Planomonospora venezuelensis]|nr:hypothetical protein Pve01_19480 [Planomonospora venezuelensis]